jgi:RND family efflux transporter MFP subunit
MKTTRTQKSLLIFAALGALVFTISTWQFNSLASNRTSKATYVTAHATCSAPRIVAEGRVANYPGMSVEISSEIAGLLVRLPIEENQLVEKGALIAELDSEELRASLVEGKASVIELDAEQCLAESETARNQRLAKTGAISRQELDRVICALAVIRARRESATATVARLEARLAKTRITAPFSGVVLHRRVEPGEAIDAYTRLATLADLSRVRIEAEVDEYDAGHVKVGAPVKIAAEGFPGQTWRGVVEEVPSVVVDKGLQPVDPSRPVDVRVLLVKIAFQESTPLKLGQRTEVEIAGEESQQARRAP